MSDRTQSFLFATLPELGRLADLFRCPGLTVSPAEIKQLAERIAKGAAVLRLKRRPALEWVLFMGGTGTGKSTLFNAFCGSNLSAAGVERPKTQGPILFAPRGAEVSKLLGADPGPPEPASPQAEPVSSGSSGRLTVIEHERPHWRHLILVDTPDLDSVATANRDAAQDLYLLADVVVFVSSQEKYADEVPYGFLLRVLEERKPLYFILNKAQPNFSSTELLEPLRAQGPAPAPAQVWLIPFAPYRPEQWIAQHPAFRHLKETLLSTIGGDGSAERRAPRLARQAATVRRRINHLQTLLAQEQSAAAAWLERLEDLYRSACRALIDDQRQHLAAESRQYLQAEIRRLFARYDVLARPRRLLREFFLAPLRLLGIAGPQPGSDGREALRRVRDKIDLAPVQSAVVAFNRSVLQELSPAAKDAPLFREIRRGPVALTETEVRQLVWREQERLVEWLEETFKDLAGGISKTKEWGIYSTSIVWGILILAFETTVGGGFTVIDAALDSALAPFVTKGAVELFAHQEIQRVARQLAERYRNALVAVLNVQKERYTERMEVLLPTASTRQQLAELEQSLERSDP